MKDIKVMDSIYQAMNEYPYISNVERFAEAVSDTRNETRGVAIEEIAKCFRYQFDEAELESLIRELSKGKL